MKTKNDIITVEFTYKERMGRIPTPKKGGAMKAKRGKGSYTRKTKHKRGY